MKKLLVILLIPVLLCACREGEQIDELAFVKILAIDKTENGLLVTAGIQLPKAKNGETLKGKDRLSVECTNVAEGLNKLEASTDKKVFFGQISCILIGEEMAREGIIDTVDYFVRSDELRFDIPIVVVKDDLAKIIVDNADNEEAHISDKITKRLESNYSTSSSGVVELSKLVAMLEDSFRSPYLPYMIAEEDEFIIEGYCVFKDDKLTEYLDKECSLGVNILNDTVHNWLYNADADGKNVALKIDGLHSRIKMKDGVFNVDIKFESEVIQADSEIERFDTQLVSTVTRLQNEETLRIVNKTLKKLKEIGCDVARFGDTFHNVSPHSAAEFKGNWGESFRGIQVNVSVTSKLDPAKTSGKPVKQGGD